MPSDLLARVRDSFARQGLMRTLAAEVTRVDQGLCEIRFAAAEAISQQDGFVHAGALTAAADTAGGYAAYTLMEHGENVLSVEFKVNLLEPARRGDFLARGVVLRPGGRLFVCDIEVVRLDSGTRCLKGLQTVVRVPARGT